MRWQTWTRVEKLDSSLIGQTVLVRARVHNVRAKGKSAFMVLRQNTSTAQVNPTDT